MQPSCHVEEKIALLQFKQGFKIIKTASRGPSAYPKILSWGLKDNKTTDCCSWDGVYCDETTGHVIGLDLSSSFIYGSIDSESSLFSLVHLRTLNLAHNHFNYSLIPSKIASLSRLSLLNLSSSVFSGSLPATLSNMTKLTKLDLRNNVFSGQVPSLSSMQQLSYLSLAYNNFSENIPVFIMNMTSLAYLDLGFNNFSGIIPSWLTNLTHLTHIDLAYNPVQGLVPRSFSQLENLEYLSLLHANLNGTVEADTFLSLKKLTYLQLSHTSISFVENNKTNLTLPQLKYLGLSACNTRKFPSFLRFQDELESLFLDGNQIEGLIPEWVWNKSRESMDSLWLAENLITGFEYNPVVLPWARLRLLDISVNMFQGSLPVPPPSTLAYDASGNRMTGEISPLICQMNSLYTLELSDNSLGGKIPSCLGNFSNKLMRINLEGNNFFGTIPEISSQGLRMVDLSWNQFEGKIPRSLANCTLLQLLNLGNNQIDDSFPLWLGTLPELQVLILRSNKFHGIIENHTTNSEFPKLRIIDLYNNSFAGNLPLEHFKNCDAMKFEVDKLSYLNITVLPSIAGWTVTLDFSITITNKGVKLLYEKVSNMVTFIDLSSNNFTGKIPDSISSFTNLHFLNLSSNGLNGAIPAFIGNLTALESFDISRNEFTGKIPQELAGLRFLSIFNVSYNNLTGPIPHGKQFDSFQNDSYMGNMGLCGPPLSTNCGEEQTPLSSKEEDDGDSLWSAVDVIIISIGFGSGLIVGIIYGDKLATKCYKYIIIRFLSKLMKTSNEEAMKVELIDSTSDVLLSSM